MPSDICISIVNNYVFWNLLFNMKEYMYLSQRGIKFVHDF